MQKSILSLTATLEQIQNGLGALLPEILLAVFCLLVVFTDLFKSNFAKSALPFLALLGFGLVLWVQFFEGFSISRYARPEPFLLGLLIKDGLSMYAGILFNLAAILTILLAWQYQPFKTHFFGRGEFYAYLLVLVVGLNLMVKSANLLLLFVSIELVSIASYLLTMIVKENVRSTEAGMKYILYGTMAAGVMLYGMSFLYGFTGSLQFLQPDFWQAVNQVYPVAVTVGIVLTLAGLLFKISAAPFHFWAPDVYENTPTPVVALFSTAPKIAGILVLLRFVEVLKAQKLYQALYFDVLLFVAGIALFTLVIGNFTALWQSKPKRMLAYSSVSHAGFMLAACLSLSGDNLSNLLFYVTILLFTNFGIFLFIQEFEEQLGVFTFPDFSGWGKHYPFIGIVAIVFLISLTGLPPTAGFTAKLLVFSSVWQTYQVSGNPLMLLLVVAGLLFTGVAFFYYVKIPYFLFFKRNFRKEKKVIPITSRVLILVLALPVVVFFFRTDWLINFIHLFIK
ncbi:proton-translocating NADH-quinone oxidoreductase subunit N [Adhaeribacter arboris]|uniref:NADH-quinone oxidoreductase subunit N n=1 Tax=Adhaeribacter arboris TaxID=2072846 RepID=A0A2T2YG92_9BACT|nr:NADH-quinone oxidoreductase subunit N [Adhaeribacter arboris]PSR54529.1 proton-translocating NADH-quinone oxidoreductase subunit N [Adhaeribacter arboris]